jgi:pyruvate formate lyase activating enzyme
MGSVKKLIIGGIIVSSIEYPGKISLVIFTGGCILKCPYCHNPELISGGNPVEINTIKTKINESLEYIDGITITGGEPLIQWEDVKDILQYSKKLKLKTKIDTNGFNPERIAKIIKWTDYIALDIKVPFNKYESVTGMDIGDDVKKSMDICFNTPNIFLECRTTYVPGLLNHEDIMEIAKNVHCNLYTIQQFRNQVVLDDKLKQTHNPSRDELLEIVNKIKPILGKVKLKTAEFGDEII